MFKKIIKNKSGFSLLEMLVAVTVFSVTVVSSTQIFSMIVTGQRGSMAAANLQESMHYAFESIAKEIRGAVVSNGECSSLIAPEPEAVNKVYNTTTNAEGDVLYFKNSNDVCTAYYLNNGTVTVVRGNNIAPTTSSKVTVSNLDFVMVDDSIGAFHSVQPRITMRLEVEADGKGITKQKMEMQTTISGRYYE